MGGMLKGGRDREKAYVFKYMYMFSVCAMEESSVHVHVSGFFSDSRLITLASI